MEGIMLNLKALVLLCRWSAPLLALVLALICAGCDSGPAPLTAEMPLHLEDHLDAATIEGSEVPEDIPEPVEWRFDEPQPDWKPEGYESSQELHTLVRTSDALRVVIETADSDGDFYGYVYTDVPDWQLQDWAYVAVEARFQPGMEYMSLGFNHPAQAGEWSHRQARGLESPLIADGTVQTYLFRPDPVRGEFDGTWRQLLLPFKASVPSTFDLLSVKVIPKEAAFVSARVGVSMEALEGLNRRTLYTHAPGKLTYQVRIPDAGQLDVGLRVVRRDAPVTFRVTATPSGGEAETRLEETVSETEQWAQRRVDLSDLAGQTVSLALEADAERGGSVALWAAPTLSGARTTETPNIIFYIIDGGAADSMSVYGYNRRTTPNLERLAAEGAVFENAYSNSSWTRPSTLSFLTSLHHSVLGGLRNGRNTAPDEVLTLAKHLHRAGYQTAFFTSNANAGTISGLERGIDVLREAGVDNNATSSVELHENFWRWREAYPAEPYWVRFQTTDVHGPSIPVPPFAGLYVTPELRETFLEWQEQLEAAGGRGPYSDAFEKTGISRQEFYDAARSLYDETMAHQDYQIGQLVDRLKEMGEWSRTLLIIAADHGHAAAYLDFGLGLLDPLPPIWEGAMLSSFQTRGPMIFVWPGRIPGGQRFRDPVSMIDMLPTILDFVDLPMPEVMQGQSLAPLLLGEEGWEPRPVILDEVRVVDSGDYKGWIEVIDDRWGASLLIDPGLKPGDTFLRVDFHEARSGHGANPGLDEGEVVLRGHRVWPVAGSSAYPNLPTRIPRLLLYDLWADRPTLNSLHEERPDLVEKYTKFLEEQWKAHQALAQQFTRPEDSPLTAEQLRTLRALGYIR